MMDPQLIATLLELADVWCYGQFETATVAPISPDQQRADGMALKKLLATYGHTSDGRYAGEPIGAPGPTLSDPPWVGPVRLTYIAPEGLEAQP
jgi:hypothetical protein